VLASALILMNGELVPLPAAGLWLAGVAALIVVRWRLHGAEPLANERAAQIALAVTFVYVAVMVAASAAARADVRAAFAARGVEPEAVMVGPVAANPFAGDVIVVTRDDYYTGRFSWLAEPRVEPEGEQIDRPRGTVFEAAAQAPFAQRFLTWSRFPVAEVEQAPDGGTTVRLSDLRYRDRGQLLGPTIRLDRELRVVGAD
jgi:hypothetical protein